MSELPIPDLPDFCWPVDTSCVPDWDEVVTPGNPEADPPTEDVLRYSPEEKARAIALAGQSMRLLTGYRIGGCPVTVRPCRSGCSDPTWRTYPVGGSGSVPWHPVSLGGSWLNIGCGHGGGCSCSVIHEVQLYGPAPSAVTEVKVDGLVLDESAYRLDRNGMLVRTDGDAWPLCQNLSAPDTDAGTWSVTYSPSASVDGLGAAAAGLLAGEYVRLCAGGSCDLPDTVTQIVRQGVTMTLTPGAFPNGQTGLRQVDAYLAAVNPHRLVAPSAVWSPDVTPARY